MIEYHIGCHCLCSVTVKAIISTAKHLTIKVPSELRRRPFEGQRELPNLTFIWKLDRRIDKWWFFSLALEEPASSFGCAAVAVAVVTIAAAAFVFNFKPQWMTRERIEWSSTRTELRNQSNYASSEAVTIETCSKSFWKAQHGNRKCITNQNHVCDCVHCVCCFILFDVSSSRVSQLNRSILFNRFIHL